MSQYDPECIAFILTYIYTGVLFESDLGNLDTQIRKFITLFFEQHDLGGTFCLSRIKVGSEGQMLPMLVKIYLAADYLLVLHLPMLCKNRLMGLLRGLEQDNVEGYAEAARLVYMHDSPRELQQIFGCAMHEPNYLVLNQFTEQGEALIKDLVKKFPQFAFDAFMRSQSLRSMTCIHCIESRTYTGYKCCPNGDFHSCEGFCMRASLADLRCSICGVIGSAMQD